MEEALLREEGTWGVNKGGRITERETGEIEGRAESEEVKLKVLKGRRGVPESFLRWALLVAENVRAADKEAAAAIEEEEEAEVNQRKKSRESPFQLHEF